MSLPFAKCRLSADGISYFEQGQGKPVVLIHGVGLCADVWLPQQRALSLTRRVISLDLPGHGASAALVSVRQPGLDDYACAIERMLRSLPEESVTLVGHSLGALLAIRLINRRQISVSSAILMSGIYQRDASARDAVQHRARQLRDGSGEDLTEATLRRWFGTQAPDPLRSYASQCRRWLNYSRVRGYPAAYSAFAAQVGPSKQELQSLDVPVLFFTGADDCNSTPSMSQAMSQLAPLGRAYILEGGAHMIGMTHAEEVNSVLSDFCSQC